MTIFWTWILLMTMTILTRLLPMLFTRQIQNSYILQELAKFLPVLVMSLLSLHLILPYFNTGMLEGFLAIISISVCLLSAYFKLPLILGISLAIISLSTLKYFFI